MSLTDYCKVQIGFGYDPFATPTWTDVSADCRRWSGGPSRRASQFESFSAGRVVITLDNQDRTYDPAYSSGTHFGDFKRYTPVRIRANAASGWVTVFRGFVRTWTVKYPTVNDSVTEVEALDGLWVLSESYLDQLDEHDFYNERVDARIGRILDLVGWPSGDRDLDTTSPVDVTGTRWGTDALRAALAATNSDGGFFFYDPATEKLRFDTRDAIALDSSYSTSQDTFYDASTEPVMLSGSLQVGGVGDNYRNKVSITAGSQTYWMDETDSDGVTTRVSQTVAGSTQTVDNVGANEAERAYALASEVSTAAYAAGLANFNADLYGTETPFVEQFQVRPFTAASAPRDEALDVGLRDRITVSYDPPGAGGAETMDVFVDSIHHRVDESEWVTTFGCSSADAYDNNLAGPPSDWMVLDDGTLGELDAYDLGY